MATHPPTSDPTLERANARKRKQRKQITAVAVLGCLLVIALLCQPKTESVDPIEFDSPSSFVSTKMPASQTLAAEPEQLASLSIDHVNEHQPNSPELTLSRLDTQAIVRSPLLAASILPANTTETATPAKRVIAVYGSANGHAALMGDSIVRTGQSLPDGRRVLQVHPRGVHVSE